MFTIAFCYDLKSDYLAKGFSEEECFELDVEETIEAIIHTLEELGHKVVKIGDIKSLVRHLANDPQPSWDLVFNISEGMFGVAREAQISGLLEAYQIPCTFSDAATLALCLDKGKTKMILQSFGIPTAPFAIVHNTFVDKNSTTKRGTDAIANSTYVSQLSFPLFAKPIAEGSSKGVLPGSRINGPDELNAITDRLCAQFPGQDILIEKFLGGRELTIGLVGTGRNARVLGALEIKRELLAEDYVTYESKNKYEGEVYEFKPDNDPEVQLASETALKVWKALGCRDAGRVDFRSDKLGEGAVPHFLEVNPLAGLRPNYSHLSSIADYNGVSYVQLVDIIVKSAMERTSKKRNV